MEITSKYLTSGETCSILQVGDQTLRRWEKEGKIETIRAPGKYSHRKYNVKKFLEENSNFGVEIVPKIRRKICYCRVSTRNQKDDLKRQIEYMRGKYPDYELIKDTGSGLNFKRKGLNKILDYGIKGEIEELVVAYKDRLCRFGFEFFEEIIRNYSKGKIVVLNETNFSPEEELTKDMLAIITVFSARINGFRKYKNQIKEDKDISFSNPEEDDD